MPDRDKVLKGLEALDEAMHKNQCYACSNEYVEAAGEFGTNIIRDAIILLKEQDAVVRCKDCKWYDERISMCDNCGLPREQTFFCADGERK